MLKFWIGFNGFCVGSILGALIGAEFGGANGAGMAATIMALILGILGAWLAFKLYMLGVFLQCFVMGFLFGAILGYFAGGTSAMVPVGVICALAAAIAGVILTKPIIIISTGLTGGLSAGVSLAILLNTQIPAIDIILGLILAALGIFVQFKTNEKKSNQAVFQTPPYTVQNHQQFATQQSQGSNYNAIESQTMADGAAQALNTAKDSAAKSGTAISNIVEEPETVPQTSFCPQCGHACSPHTKFCPACGRNLATQTDETITPKAEESSQTNY